MTKIKICGLTSIADARIINDLKVDYAGVVMFCPKSKRNTSPEDAKKITAALDDTISSVAVVVSPTAEQIKIIEDCGFDIIQIHGKTDTETLETVRLPVFKAFNAGGSDELEAYSGFGNIKGFVFDAAQPGSGKTFDWSVLRSLDPRGRYVILAGGLDPDNVTEAIEYLHPDIVDVSSGVEEEGLPGKSRSKAVRFVSAVRGYKA